MVIWGQIDSTNYRSILNGKVKMAYSPTLKAPEKKSETFEMRPSFASTDPAIPEYHNSIHGNI